MLKNLTLIFPTSITLSQPFSPPHPISTTNKMAVTIDLGAILKYGSLIVGISIALVGVLKTVSVFTHFNIVWLIFSLSQILFGVLIAHTFKPVDFLAKVRETRFVIRLFHFFIGCNVVLFIS